MSEVKKITIQDKNKSFRCPILIGKNILNKTDNLFFEEIQNKKVFMIYDSFFRSKKIVNNNFLNLQKLISEKALKYNPIPIKSGDRNKNFFTLEKLINKILSKKIDRDSIIITFGGGVVGDIGGFAASILLRGIKLIQIPTTLLAQVDSSVGGKTGINTIEGKNLVGSFYQPSKVLIDTSLLKTLPKRELYAGFAEVIKYSFIYDKSFYKYLSLNYNSIIQLKQPFLNYTIYKSCLIKSKIVSEDEKENGIRAILNLGHTFGHAFESILNYSPHLIHGEAVSIGMCMAFRFSNKLGLCNLQDVEKVENLLLKFKLPISIKNYKKFNLKTTSIFKKLYSDKKVKNGKLSFVLCSEIGKSFIKNDVPNKVILNFLKEEINE